MVEVEAMNVGAKAMKVGVEAIQKLPLPHTCLGSPKSAYMTLLFILSCVQNSAFHVQPIFGYKQIKLTFGVYLSKEQHKL